MKAITRDEMRELEKSAIDAGIPARVLMEVAGMKAAAIASNEVKKAMRATVICGSGGNGGDGLVAARYLNNGGIRTDIFLTEAESSISSPDSLANLAILKRSGIDPIVLNGKSLGQLNDSLVKADIVIDAIFGIGFKGEPKDSAAKAIDLINTAKNEIKDKRRYLVVSIDVPSGADADSGDTASKCVEADVTVTFEYPKLGLLKYPASRYAGKIVTATIGIPRTPLTKAEGQPAKEKMKGIQVTDSGQVAAFLPRRRTDSNKGSFGSVLVVAGSSGMMGAAVLTASSALRTGSGLVTLCVPDGIKEMVNSMSLETVVAGMSELSEKVSSCDVIALGPGLTKGPKIIKLIKDLLLSKKADVPLVIDADAINAVSDPALFKRSHKDIVITPHPGEFSRLTGESIDNIQRDRMGSASKFAVKYGITVVLKGAYTVIAGKDKLLYVNPTGNPGMASAGAGDVLTGIIASLIGQGLSTFNASVAGAYIHGMAGNLAASIKGEHGVIASDIIDSIPYTMNSIF